MKEKVTAIVTLYFPNESVYNNIVNLTKQVDRVLLSDNSPTDNKSFFSEISKTEYHWNQKNLGLPAAFNSMFQNNCFDDSEFIIFFDQDSSIPDGYVKSLIEYFETIEKTSQIGCLGPQYIDTNTNKVINPRFIEEIYDGCYVVSSMITSGLMTKFKILKEIGFWNEQIFLDMADWDFCWRLVEYNYKIVLCTHITLIHTLGKGIKQIGPIKLRKNHHVREYYQIRDCKKLMKEKYVPIKYKIRFLIMLFIMPIFYITFLPKRFERFRYIMHAFFDNHKNGSYESLHKNK